MNSCHGNFSNEGPQCGEAAAIRRALTCVLGKWWPQKYLWQRTCTSHGNTGGRATSSHEHVSGNDILSGIITHVANQF